MNVLLGLAAGVLYALIVPGRAAAQDVVLSTAVAPLGAGAAASRVNIDTVKPQPSTARGPALPALSLTDDGTGPQVRTLMLQMPAFDLGGIAVASGVGDQRVPAVFRDSSLAGPAMASTARGLTLAFKSSAPVSLSFAPTPAAGTTKQPAPGFAAAVSFNPSSRVSVTPKVLLPGSAVDSQRSVGTAVRTNLVSNVALTTEVIMAGAADRSWTPVGSARLVGQWRRAGIETIVLRGAAAPATGANTAIVSSRDREAAQAQFQPMRGLTLAALTSVSRPSADPDADDTAQNSLRLAYDGLRSGQLAAVQQWEATSSRESDQTSLEWRQRGGMTVRYVRQSASDSASTAIDRTSSRVELDFPVPTSRTGCLALRAALSAGTISQTDTGVSSKVSGRLALIDNAALIGETELGITGADGQLLRGLRLTTEMPVVQATHLQLSYAYRTGTQLPVGQVFEARILRRFRLGW